MTSAPAHSLEATPPPGRPHPALRSLVDSYLGYHQSLPSPGVHHGLPSSVLTVVFAFDEPLDAGWMRAPGSRARYWSLASGLHTEPAEIRHQGLQSGIQLGLTAQGARRLLGMPMRELAAQIVSVEDLLGRDARVLHDRLREQSTWQQRYQVLDESLLALARSHHSADASPRPELAWSWQRIQTSAGAARVDEIARELGWSRRHLTETFAAEFGLGPKRFARVARFERSKAGLFARRPLAAVAADCGYADQAHLSREWQAMAGYSPREWQRIELPFLQDPDASGMQAGRHEQ